MIDSPQLHVVMYHYVRDLPRTRFPQIKGLLTDRFRSQVQDLRDRFEMASLESCLAFLKGDYTPSQDLCLLTFDDGLKDHFTDVLPILASDNIQGLFFITTACLEEHRVLAVHKNHFLMAELGFTKYRQEFLNELKVLQPDFSIATDTSQAKITYRFDEPDVAVFKYLLNFQLPDQLRQKILDRLFERFLGRECEFAKELYLNWEEARTMQAAGMLIGGHSHNHVALATMGDAGQREDLECSMGLLRKRLATQQNWPFSYPYGNPADSFDDCTVATIRQLDVACAFTTERGTNSPGQDLFRLHRIDTNDVSF